jgi:uncharacterized protein
MDLLEQNLNEQPSANDNQLAMWGHLIGILSCINGLWGILGILGTVIFYAINQDKSRFVRLHAAQSLNFQITYFLCFILMTALVAMVIFGNVASFSNSAFTFSTMGAAIVTGIIFIVINLVGCIKSALAAQKGGYWHNPMAITFIKVK